MKALLVLALFGLTACGHLKFDKLLERPKSAKTFHLERSWARHTVRGEYLAFRLNHISEPVVFENLVIQGNEIDGLRAYDKISGRLKWEKAINGGVTSGARLAGEKLFFGGGDGYYYAVEARTGATKWAFPVRTESLGAPLVDGETVYFLSGSSSVYALKADSGEQIWVYSRPDTLPLTVRGASEPTLAAGKLLIGFSDGFLVALDPNKGSMVWEKQLGEGPRFKDVDTKPVLDGNKIYVGSYDGRLYCLKADSGDTVWSHDEGAFLPVTIDGDRLYYATSTRKVIAMDKSSGKVLWERELSQTVGSQPVLHRGLVLFGEWQGSVRALDALSGKDVASFYTGRGTTSRITVEPKLDRLYLMTADANLFALKLELKGAKEMWAWEK